MRLTNFRHYRSFTLALAFSSLLVANAEDHSVKMNLQNSQMVVRTTTGELKYYDTESLNDVNIDHLTNTVNIFGKDNSWNDSFNSNISEITFSKAFDDNQEAVIVDRGVKIIEARGWQETVYAKWQPLEGAATYRVYIKGVNDTDYKPVDRELVRNYGSYGRVDVPGLCEGSYCLKIVPVISGTEDHAKASEATAMQVRRFDRSGFAHLNHEAVGAYKSDGSLKDNAKVIYVTAENAKTVSCDIFYDKAYKTFSGLQTILKALEKGTSKDPLCIRIIGQIKDSDLDYLGSKSEGLQIKGKNNTIPLNLTIEGIGNDATLWGFGILLRKTNSVELRNFASMNCMDDCISIDTDNTNCWAHNLDFFYGNAGSDKDQVKGDGTIDIKGDSKYVTVSYCRFHDSGKSSLCGMKSETGPNYIDYHHNWFDHSDSRHPRVRTMSVHVWNNYYDGTAKYGAGATSGCSIFMENNFFRTSKRPMLTNKQGTDAMGSGTFDDANGGMIKSFGNVYAETVSGAKDYVPITQITNAANFDCVETTSRDEKVPDTFKAKAGGSIYNNFDTDHTLMYQYTPVPAVEVPALVTGYYGAGRINHGDFAWDMNYPEADSDYNVIPALKAALNNYKSSLVGIFE